MYTYTWKLENRKYILESEWTRRVFSLFRRKMKICQVFVHFSAEQEKPLPDLTEFENHHEKRL